MVLARGPRSGRFSCILKRARCAPGCGLLHAILHLRTFTEWGRGGVSLWRTQTFCDFRSPTAQAVIEVFRIAAGEYQPPKEMLTDNYRKPHQGIGGLCPADRYFEIQSELRKTMEAGIQENLLEMALRGQPRAPFYGGAGDRVWGLSLRRRCSRRRTLQ